MIISQGLPNCTDRDEGTHYLDSEIRPSDGVNTRLNKVFKVQFLSPDVDSNHDRMLRPIIIPTILMAI